jgi:tRNA-dihydrouridine synthase B
VTVKTRIGYGPESHMPIVDLARRLEDAACRGAHDPLPHRAWRARGPCRLELGGARRASVVTIPVIVNGDIKSAADAKRALDETGCDGVMIGRAAIDHPWLFGEVRQLLDHGVEQAPPTPAERLALCREHLLANVATRTETYGVKVTRRHLTGYLRGLRGAASIRKRLLFCDSLAGCLEILAEEGERLAA